MKPNRSRDHKADYARKRKYPCKRVPCEGRAVNAGGFCSRSCNRSWHLAQMTPEARRVAAMKAVVGRGSLQIARLLQRVKVLADGEDARILLAWRIGKIARKSARFREKQGRAA